MLLTFLVILYHIRTMTFEPRLNSKSDADGPGHDKTSVNSSASRRPNVSTNFEGEEAKSKAGFPTYVGFAAASSNDMGHSLSTSDDHEKDEELINLSADVYDIIRVIRDPEKPNTLEELQVVQEEGIHMTRLEHMEDAYTVHIAFTPTVPHCSLATLIGLCIRVKLERSLPYKHKVNISIQKGTHSTEESINKQINDKERIAAAMENPNLRELVETCIKEEDY